MPTIAQGCFLFRGDDIALVIIAFAALHVLVVLHQRCSTRWLWGSTHASSCHCHR